MFKKIIFITLLLLVLSACASTADTPVPQDDPASMEDSETENLVDSATLPPAPSQTPSPEITLTPSPLPTSPPTATFTPSPTMTFTPTPLPRVLLTTFSSYTSIMMGPGVEYDTLAITAAGIQFEVVGQNENWMLVDLGFGQTGWISLESADVEGPVENVAIVEAPPTPTPTITPIPQPVILSLGADKDSVRVVVDGFNPSEFITIQIIQLSTGNVIHVQTLNVYPAGNHPGIRVDPKEEMDPGDYTLLIIGESGRSVSRRFTIKP